MSIAEKLTTVAENQQRVYDAGYNAGQQAGGGGDNYYDTLWDSLQENGARVNYWGAFAGWKDDIFNPKYVPIVVGQGAYMFRDSTIEAVPTISLTAAVLDNMFYNAKELETIEMIDLPVSVYSAPNAFTNCTELKNIAFSGEKKIECTISFSTCPLTRASIESVVAALSNKATGQTITFKTTAVDAAFTTEEWNALVAAKPNWTFAKA